MCIRDSDEEEQQEMEDISYSGDPEDPDEAVKQWSEHEWSSQEEEANDDWYWTFIWLNYILIPY